VGGDAVSGGEIPSRRLFSWRRQMCPALL